MGSADVGPKSGSRKKVSPSSWQRLSNRLKASLAEAKHQGFLAAGDPALHLRAPLLGAVPWSRALSDHGLHPTHLSGKKVVCFAFEWVELAVCCLICCYFVVSLAVLLLPLLHLSKVLDLL